MYRIVTPESAEQLAAYYQLRWQLLRQPFCLPVGSERDEYDALALHRLMLNEAGNAIAVGRVFIAGEEAQIRFMAVHPDHRGQGLGRQMVDDLVQQASAQHAKRVVMNARQEAVGFYRQCGFLEVGEGPMSVGRISHRQMIRTLTSDTAIAYRPQWCQDLMTRWRSGIPICDKMCFEISHYDGEQLHIKAKLAANLNVHDQMFAGSAYSQCVLAGWGLIWLQLKERGWLANSQLIRGQIENYQAIYHEPQARAHRADLLPYLVDFTPGQSKLIPVAVQLYSADQLAAEFVGHYQVTLLKGCRSD